MSWKLTDHVCRVCLGRVLTRTTRHGTESRCAECGIRAPGDHRQICACGTQLKNGHDALLRCQRNPNRSPELPAEIVAVFVEEA